MLVLLYWINFIIDILLYFQPEEESETSNNQEYGYLKFYRSLLMCVVDAFRVNWASLVQCTKIGYLICEGHQKQVSWLQLGSFLLFYSIFNIFWLPSSPLCTRFFKEFKPFPGNRVTYRSLSFW